MRIGIIIPSPPAYSETFFTSKIKALQEKGNEVILFANSKDRKNNDFSVVYAPKLHPNSLVRMFQSFYLLIGVFVKAPKVSSKLWRLHRSSGDGIVASLKSIIISAHIINHNLDWLHFGFATMGVDREFVGKAIGAKVAVSFRGYDIHQTSLTHGPEYYERLFEQTDVIHSISNYLINHARWYFNLSEFVKIQVIQPAIDTDKFKFQNPQNNLGKNKRLRLLVVSRLHWIKNIEDIIHSLSLLIHKYGMDAELTIVGDGNQYERLKYAAYQLGVYKQVVFKGMVSSDQIPKFYHEHDIFIQYSHAEGFCNAVLEAQASGTLVVVSDTEGLIENISVNETGWSAQRSDPHALASTILKVYNLPEPIKAEVRQNARLRVEKQFNLHNQIEQFVNMYNQTKF